MRALLENPLKNNNISMLYYNARSLYPKPHLLKVEGIVHNPHVSTRRLNQSLMDYGFISDAIFKIDACTQITY